MDLFDHKHLWSAAASVKTVGRILTVVNDLNTTLLEPIQLAYLNGFFLWPR